MEQQPQTLCILAKNVGPTGMLAKRCDRIREAAEAAGIHVGVKTRRHTTADDFRHAATADYLICFGWPWSQLYRRLVQIRVEKNRHVVFVRAGRQTETTIISEDSWASLPEYDWGILSDEELLAILTRKPVSTSVTASQPKATQ